MFGERRALLEVDLAVLLNLHERLAKSATQSSGATGMDLSVSGSPLPVFHETKNQEFHLKMGSTTLNFRVVDHLGRCVTYTNVQSPGQLQQRNSFPFFACSNFISANKKCYATQ